ncbi:SAM-dependent methyltransferase [Yinghuangia sp. ASG 101]|uniref:SAM-dependent methyltransferase n=1 Tax=Yinghuangia sp. ASG 101 TaxID=2896848 RepID=UPI001E57F966|nr:SAM-dependent methyltransferase [Yinghuangia sp. ASG 101]UGQ10284.1 SAM-dependent methyltransferase [Yinghuangia sp. ASG 101]
MTQQGSEPWRLPRGDEVETHESQRVDTTTAHPARMYDYYLGGKNNFAVDRAAADLILDAAPEARTVARAGRDFLARAVRFTAGRLGIRQYLDVGTGIPADGNVHEVAQAVIPESRVVYLDNDPIVLAHARALVSGDPRGRIATGQADLREPEAVLTAPAVRESLDFTQPVAVVLGMVLHFIRDSEDPAGLVARLCAPLAPGSALIVSHITYRSDALKKFAEEVYDRASAPVVPRTHEEVAALLAGLAPVDPGLVRATLWRPEPGTPAPTPEELVNTTVFGAVALKH